MPQLFAMSLYDPLFTAAERVCAVCVYNDGPLSAADVVLRPRNNRIGDNNSERRATAEYCGHVKKGDTLVNTYGGGSETTLYSVCVRVRCKSLGSVRVVIRRVCLYGCLCVCAHFMLELDCALDLEGFPAD